MQYTEGTPSVNPVTADEIRKAIAELKPLANVTYEGENWILISPKGEVYKGDIGAITGVLMRNHPIFKPSISDLLKDTTK